MINLPSSCHLSAPCHYSAINRSLSQLSALCPCFALLSGYRSALLSGVLLSCSVSCPVIMLQVSFGKSFTISTLVVSTLVDDFSHMSGADLFLISPLMEVSTVSYPSIYGVLCYICEFRQSFSIYISLCTCRSFSFFEIAQAYFSKPDDLSLTNILFPNQYPPLRQAHVCFCKHVVLSLAYIILDSSYLVLPGVVTSFEEVSYDVMNCTLNKNYDLGLNANFLFLVTFAYSRVSSVVYPNLMTTLMTYANCDPISFVYYVPCICFSYFIVMVCLRSCETNSCFLLELFDG